MSLFAIGDLHLSLGKDKPMDIFKGWDGYVEKIAAGWKKLVGPEDTVVIAGDVSWAMDLPNFREDAGFLHALPGRKLIVKGNHDYWWTTVSKMNAFFEQNGFTSLSVVHNSAFPVEGVAVCGTRGWFNEESGDFDEKIMLREAGRLETSLRLGAATGLEPVAFLHFPPVYGNSECGPLMEVLRKYGVRRCYYGHLHGKAAQRAVQGLYRGIRLRLVACDSTGFCPIPVESQSGGPEKEQKRGDGIELL